MILILGPTAGGKTRLAIDLARQLPGGGECISADSMQVYRGMDIGTGKASLAERGGVPHHLIDIAEPDDDSFSVDRWLELAQTAIDEIQFRGRWPIIVGGTNLYVRALLDGLADLPAPDLSLRARLQGMRDDELRAWLERIDPASATRIHRNDRKRTIRAIEVFEQTGKPLSAMQTQWQEAIGCGGLVEDRIVIIGLDYPVDAINPRINARVKAMIEAGLVDEVRRLYESKRLGRNAREALGYKQIIDHFEGRCSLEVAIEQIKIRTRRYAKQQRTWLRRFRNRPASIWLDADSLTPEAISEKALAFVENAQKPPSSDAPVPR